MRPIRDDSGERIGWWIGERFVPEDGSDLTRRDAEIAALREAVRYCYDEGKLTREVEDAIDRARGRRALEEKP